MGALVSLLLLLWVPLWGNDAPQHTPAVGEAVVHTVLFYSPTCPHCHRFIDESLPPILEKYGSHLRILAVNVTTRRGHLLFENAIEWIPIPEEQAGVPTLIINHAALVGSQQIPKELPPLLDEGIQQGGMAWPDIPGLQQAIQREAPSPALTFLTANWRAAPPPPLGSRLASDPFGNGLAISLLFLMVITGWWVVRSWIKRGWPTKIYHNHRLFWIPLLSFIGIGVAGYLSYLEVADAEGVCGPIGNCHVVQQSSWSRFLGIPVGLIGLVGYLLIFSTWLIALLRSSSHPILIPITALLIFVGMLFSFYLTFLEPFIIGTVCLWCLTSALLITLLLWTYYTPAKKLEGIPEEN